MKRLILVAALLLTGCEKRQWSHDEIADIAKDAAPDYSARLDQMQSEIDELKQRIEDEHAYTAKVHNLAEATSDYARTTSDTVRRNAEVANDNALQDMTRNGACGYRTVRRPAPNGSSYTLSEPIQCTRADLRK